MSEFINTSIYYRNRGASLICLCAIVLVSCRYIIIKVTVRMLIIIFHPNTTKVNSSYSCFTWHVLELFTFFNFTIQFSNSIDIRHILISFRFVFHLFHAQFSLHSMFQYIPVLMFWLCLAHTLISDCIW